MIGKYKFIFDLDSTLTKEEILPEISKSIGAKEIISKLTEETMMGNLSFEESFSKRVDILKRIPISEVHEIIDKIELNEDLIRFISENRDRCIIITGNIDIWISELMKKLKMENRYYSSIACTNGKEIESIIKIIKKEEIVRNLKGPIVAVGDGSNDSKMIECADIGIGFGGVRPIAPSVLKVCDYAFYEEAKLCQFLRRLL